MTKRLHKYNEPLERKFGLLQNKSTVARRARSGHFPFQLRREPEGIMHLPSSSEDVPSSAALIPSTAGTCGNIRPIKELSRAPPWMYVFSVA